MSSVQMFFLGTPHFVRHEQVVNLTTAKAIALLAYLAVTHKAQPRDHLLALLWAESAPEAARKNLRNVLWTIRKLLGDEIIETHDDRLALSEGVWADVQQLANLKPQIVDLTARPSTLDSQSSIINPQAAIEVYRGPLLDGLTISDAPDFELWLTSERERLGQLYLRGLTALVDAARAQGDWPQIIMLTQRALAHDNLQEPMVRALMEAHARHGDRAEALRQYDHLRTLLARELSVEPLPETEALRQAILVGRWSPPNGNEQRTTIPISNPKAKLENQKPERHLPVTHYQSSIPFVGRANERSALDQALQTVTTQSQAHIVLLIGELGLGKSRLWQEWARTLPTGLMALETRGLDSAQTLPFVPLIELLRSPACFERLFTPQSPLSPIWLSEVARLLPEIQPALSPPLNVSPPPFIPSPLTFSPDEERRRLFEAFTQCLLALDARPLVVFIDDAHWADHATLDWLSYCVRRMRDQPLLLILAYRPEDAPEALTNLLAGWGREGLLQRLPLARLNADEAATLANALTRTAQIETTALTRVYTQSAGNPYFLIELLQALPAEVPPVLAELLRARIQRLPEASRQILQAAAVLTPDFDYALLARTSGRTESETIDALDGLLQAAILIERGGQYLFNHPLIAIIVRDELGGARRSFLHRRAAEGLEAIFAQRLPQVAGRLTQHYGEAGDIVRAAYYAEQAALHALSLLATAEAVAFYQRALQLEPTPMRHIRLGDVLTRHGELAEARRAYETARQQLVAQGDRSGVIQASLSIAVTYLGGGRPDEVIHWIESCIADIDDTTDPIAHTLVHFLMAAALVQSGHSSADAEWHLAEAARLAATHRLPHLAANVRLELGNLRAEKGDIEGAVRAYEDAIHFARSSQDPYQFQEVLAHNNAAYHLILLDRLPEAHAHIELALQLTNERSLRTPLQFLYSTRGEIALAEQQWADAEMWFQRALLEAERNDNARQAANLRANLALAARGRGEFETALVLLEDARAQASSLAAPHLQTQIDLWLTEVHRVRGEHAAANEALKRAEMRLKGSGRRQLLAWAERLRAEAR